MIPASGGIGAINRSQQCQDQLPLECTGRQLAPINAGCINPIQPLREFTLFMTETEKGPQPGHHMLQRLSCDAITDGRDKGLDCLTGQAGQRSIGGQSLLQESGNRHHMLADGVRTKSVEVAQSPRVEIKQCLEASRWRRLDQLSLGLSGVNYLVRSATTMMAGWVVLLFTLSSLLKLLLSSVAFPL